MAVEAFRLFPFTCTVFIHQLRSLREDCHMLQTLDHQWIDVTESGSSVVFHWVQTLPTWQCSRTNNPLFGCRNYGTLLPPTPTFMVG